MLLMATSPLPPFVHSSITQIHVFFGGFPWWLSGKESACNAGEVGLIPGSGRSPGGGHGNPLQFSCLENPMNRGAWWTAVSRAAQSDMTEVTQQQQYFLMLSSQTGRKQSKVRDLTNFVYS